MKAVFDIIFGIYAWLAFAVCVLVSIIGALLLPGLARRRRWISAAARSAFLLTGIRTEVSGLDNIPDGHCIVVANHASYVDGVILQAFLPPRFSFVIKGEMQNVPIVHYVLRRIDSKFVERFVSSGSSRDARRLLRAAADGESLAFFPEGTFVSQPGLGRFRPGAFAAAIKGHLPVVPVVIRGSRSLLPANAALPRFGRLEVDILDEIPPTDAAFRNSADLTVLARKKILAVLDEPDRLVERTGCMQAAN